MAWQPLPLETNPDRVTAQILDRLMLRLPGWAPAEGSEADPLAVFAEEYGREIADMNARAVHAADAAVAGFGVSVHRVLPLTGAAAAVRVRLVTTGPGAQVPAAFTVVGQTAAQVDVAFTLPGATVAGADGTVEVTMLARQVGDEANGVPAGPLSIVTATATVTSAAALAASSGGVDAETLLAYLDRLTAQLELLKPGGVLARDLAVLARSVPGVHRALGIDNHDPGRSVSDGATTAASTTVTSTSAAFTATDIGRTITGAGIPAGATITAIGSATSVTTSAAATATAAGVPLRLGDVDGRERTASVFPVDAAGMAPGAGVVAELKALLESVREPNFLIRIGKPTYTAVRVVYEAVAEPGADRVAVREAVHAAGLEFLDPGRFAAGDDPTRPTWRPVTEIRYLELSRVLGSVPGVAFLRRLTVNGVEGNLPLAGRAPLPASPNAADPSTVTGDVL